MRNDLVDTLLQNRNISPEEREDFLFPSYENGLHDPFLMPDMEKAVERMHQAIENKEKIIIYADYDCDGIPGAVVLHDLLKKVGYENFEVYIPDRHQEGYGLHMDALSGFVDAKLLITVDLGITAVEEVEHAKELGIDVIVTDHHLPQAVLPDAFAILNPKHPAGAYPFDMLCGAGVAFKFVQGFLFKYREQYAIHEGWEKWLLDMVGIATLSDMVPLTGENRILAYFGMKVLEKTRRPGIQELAAMMRIDLRRLTEEDITFMIAPRLNAASRMDTPRKAFELLSETDPAKAKEIAVFLTKLNDERKSIVATIMKESKKNLSAREIGNVIVIGNPSWRVGVLGLVASRLAEEYERPVFVWGKEGGETIKGSCRSDGSVNLVSLMAGVRPGIFSNFGGHELAGGFTVNTDEIHFLEEELNKLYEEVHYAEVKESSATNIDATISFDDVTPENHLAMAVLAPHGMGNPKPTFVFEPTEIVAMKSFGKEKNHLELCFKTTKGKEVKAICFFASADSFPVSPEVGKRVSLVATFELSYFMRRPELRLRIVDVR